MLQLSCKKQEKSTHGRFASGIFQSFDRTLYTRILDIRNIHPEFFLS